MSENTEVPNTVEAIINRILTESGRAARSIKDDDHLMDTIGLDSLDLAVIVVNLEQDLGVDPFRDGAAAVRTFGALVTLYENTIKEQA